MEPKKELKDRLLDLRKDILKMTQDDFSSKINIKRSALSHIENGRTSITDRNIEDICRVFHVSRDWLVDGVEPIFVAVEKSDLLEEIAAIYAGLDERYRHELLGYVKRLAEEQSATIARSDENGNTVMKVKTNSELFKDRTGRTKLRVTYGENVQQSPDKTSSTNAAPQRSSNNAVIRDDAGNTIMKDDKGNLILKDKAGKIRVIVSNGVYVGG